MLCHCHGVRFLFLKMFKTLILKQLWIAFQEYRTWMHRLTDVFFFYYHFLFVFCHWACMHNSRVLEHLTGTLPWFILVIKHAFPGVKYKNSCHEKSHSSSAEYISLGLHAYFCRTPFRFVSFGPTEINQTPSTVFTNSKCNIECHISLSYPLTVSSQRKALIAIYFSLNLLCCNISPNVFMVFQKETAVP